MTDEERQLIKAGAQAAMQPFANLIERMFGGSVDQVGGMLEDSLRTRRQIRAIKLFQKLQRRMDESGIDPHRIPDNVWIPALQAASLEEDDGIQTMWANLLAGAATKDRLLVPLPALVEALRQISPEEAKFLDAIWTEVDRQAEVFETLPEAPQTLSASRDRMKLSDTPTLRTLYCSANGLSPDQTDEGEFGAELALENFMRLGIIEWRGTGQRHRYVSKIGWTLSVFCRHPEIADRAANGDGDGDST